MQYVNCNVFLSGDRNHCVPKAHVSVAEVVVLRALHGSDSVSGIRRVSERRTNAAEEVARLCRVYPSRAAEIRQSIFPGANPNVPVTLKDIGAEPDAPKPGGKKSRTKKAGGEPADQAPVDDDNATADNDLDNDPLA